MKNFRSFYRYSIVCLLTAGCWGCTGGSKPGEETDSDQDATATSSSKLGPLDSQRDLRIIPKLQPHRGDIVGTGKETVEGKDTVTERLSTPTKNVAPPMDSLANQALRVQLHSTELFGEAKRERAIAEEIFDQPVFLDYEVPYYKVRVGRFSDRKDAEDYLQKAKTAGYQNAWIVAVRLNVKEPQALYQNLPVLTSDSAKGK